MRRLVKRNEKLWINNQIAQLLIYMPASIIASILTLPLIILALPSSMFGFQIEKKCTRLLITLQHSISLSFWYFIGDFLFPSLIQLNPVVETILIILFTYVNFRNTITTLTNETMNKTYGS